MDAHRPVRIGLIGAGGIAAWHVRGYADAGDAVEFAAVADPVLDSARLRAEGSGAVVYADYAAMLAEADLDAVDICLPHHLHRDAIVAAAQAGRHILCEKPLCLSREEVRDVTAAVQAAGVTLMCAHNQLFLPTVARAKELIDAGALGRVYEVRTTDSFYNDFDPSTMGWRAHAATSGGGELIDTGYHPTYLLIHLAGAAPSEVTAMVARHRLEFMEGEDSANVIVRFANGVIGTLMTSWAYDAAPGTEKFAVVGERGSLWSDGVELRVQLRGEEVDVVRLEEIDTFSAEIAHFADALRTGRQPINTEVDGVHVLDVILGAYESVRTGTTTRLTSLAARP